MTKRKSAAISLPEVRNRLREAGLRCTPARVAAINCLFASPTPLSSGEIVEALEPAGFDKSTVYRTLSEFTECKIVFRLDLGDSMRHYELSDVGTHAHFKCRQCGEIQCLDDFSFEISPRKHKAVRLGSVNEVLLRGLCEACE
ncbi:MAG: transcriptional repressor [Pirellulales bacterium]|nr:transcriptional repressor [Pirellulales bacterium]